MDLGVYLGATTLLPAALGPVLAKPRQVLLTVEHSELVAQSEDFDGELTTRFTNAKVTKIDNSDRGWCGMAAPGEDPKVLFRAAAGAGMLSRTVRRTSKSSSITSFARPRS